MAASPIHAYRRQIEKELQAGNATEHTHRPALKTLVESLASGVTATNEPKRVECGAPDFAVTEMRAHGPVTVGHVEAKDVGKDLDEVERSDQMKRYLPALPNLILTDYLEFRWYVNGEYRQSARLARVGKAGKLASEKDGPEAVTDLLTAFLSHQAEPINDPKTLALRMARLTHFIRDMIVTAFDGNVASATLRDLHGAFEKALIPDLPIPQFADMFAQTLAYGLFAARVNHHGPPGSFKRLGAASEIPKTNPFLRQLFETITGTALDEEPFAGSVDDLAELLADTDIDAVLADFGRQTARRDPVFHFYETFLAAYDPKMREVRGVYYTPEPVVSYLVRSVDYLLKTRFGCANGLADTTTVEYEREVEEGAVAAVYDRRSSSEEDGARRAPLQKATSPRVLILDPACGTGTFLYAVIDHIREEFMGQGNAGMWSGYVRNHLLPRIFGFELLMAPYAVAHFKLGMQLAGHDMTPVQRSKWAYDFAGSERLGVFLTNTLEQAIHKSELLLGKFISEEANAASDIKRNLPILVVMGNPPYSGHSANRSEIEVHLAPGDSYVVTSGDRPEIQTTKVLTVKSAKTIREKTFIGKLIQDYYSVDGQPLREKNPKWLQDDYVKFIRWGQWRIERTGAGVLAFITNHGYLDNPTFRGMRRALMNSFTDIYLLNLHGNSKKKEKCPDGSKDENVFDIQQGVTLGVFVRDPHAESRGRVRYSEIWGLRETKNERLLQTDVETTNWTEIEPISPFYLFVPQSSELRPEYYAGWKIPDILLTNASTVTTARNDFSMAFDAATLIRRVEDLRDTSTEDQAIRQRYGLRDVSYWNLRDAREEVRKVTNLQAQIRDYCYRPFDFRFVFYHGAVCERLRSEVMRHMEQANLALLTHRPQSPGDFTFVYCTRMIGDQCVAANKTTGGGNSFQFPLYLYPVSEGKGGQNHLGIDALHWSTGKGRRRPNLNPKCIADLERRVGLSFVPDGKGDLGKTFGPEDVFNYIYAVLHSPTYRTRYAEFLKSDFPRVPLTSSVNLFEALCALGGELVALHLLESPKLAKPIARYPASGPNLVEKGFPKYLAPGEPEPGKSEPLPAGRVYISKPEAQSGAKGQYFEGIPPEVWNFYIGGYQVCEKWLKDRRGRTLTYDDLEHYRKVVTALSETIRLMAEIDAAIPKWPIE